MAQFGISFTPGQNGTENGAPEGAGPGSQLQQAIKILSLRLPRVLGGSALAPAPLLQGQGAMGSPFGKSGLLQTQQGQGGGMNPLLMALLQMSGLGGGMGAGPMSAPMQPKFTPGIMSPDPVVAQAKEANMADYYNSQPGGLPGAQTDFAQTSPYGPGSGSPKYGGPPSPSGGMDWLAPLLKKQPEFSETP